MYNLFLDQESNKVQGVVFYVNSSKLKEDIFYEDINNLLNVGEIPNLYEKDEIDEILQKTQIRASKMGISLDTKKRHFDFFKNMIRNNLHIIIAFSPIGNNFRDKCRKFPSLINCSFIDKFD